MDEPDLVRAEAGAKRRGAVFGGGGVDRLAFLYQGANPIGLTAGIDMTAEPFDDVGQFLVGGDKRFDRRPPRRHLVDAADVHLAIMGQRQRARDRRCRHREQMRRMLRLRCKQQALRDTETMLLIDYDEAKRLVGHFLLEDGVGADEDMDRAVG